MIRQLNIVDYETHFILGNDEHEKRSPRPVILDIGIRFVGDALPACDSDDLNDTICYSNLLEFLEKNLKNRRFNLLERAAQYVHDVVSEYIGKTTPMGKIMIRVEVKKANSLPKNCGSTSFICSDW
jgi:FolB domain-containing protein